MSGHRNWREIRRHRSPEGTARVARYKQEMREAMSLAELRQARAMTQAQLAEALEMQQPAISRLERQTDLYLSTLRKFVEGMGGTLSLEAIFPDARIPIEGFEAIGDPNASAGEGTPPVTDSDPAPPRARLSTRPG